MELRGLNFAEQWRAEASPTVFQWKEDNTSAAVTYHVTAPDSRYLSYLEVANEILGYPSYDANAHAIRRHLPMNLTGAPHLFATAITNHHGIGEFRLDRPLNLGSGYATLKSALFQRFSVTALFESPRFNVLADNETTKEYQRWTYVEQAESIEPIQKKHGQYRFVTDHSPSGIAGTPFPQGITIRSPKTHYRLTWYNVPANAVISNNSILNPAITRGMACVNHDYWPATVIPGDPVFNSWTVAEQVLDIVTGLFVGGDPQNPLRRRPGFPPGTLLFTQPTVTPHNAAATVGLVGASPSSRTPRTYDITYHLVYFDPPRDPRYPQFRGHNLCPSPGSADITGTANTASYFYLVTSNGKPPDHVTDPGRPLYETYNFDNLFTPL